jgi:hypothetical protein
MIWMLIKVEDEKRERERNDEDDKNEVEMNSLRGRFLFLVLQDIN